jgi:hypothetical protein
VLIDAKTINPDVCNGNDRTGRSTETRGLSKRR